tara:strand:+ start:187538 stop:187729 length:192 start_codon:yes stop_codon:yes gene_type:complete
MSEPEPKSPCISVCHLDEDEICQGCFRSASEIADWMMVDAQKKRDILRRADERREATDNKRPN